MKVYVVTDTDVISASYCGYDECCGACDHSQEIIGIFGSPEVAINHVDQLDWERFEYTRKHYYGFKPTRPYREYTSPQWHTSKDSRTGLFTWSAGSWEIEEVEVKE